MKADASYTQESEKILLVRIASGDQLAFTQLFNRYHAFVYDYSIKLTRSKFHAEEIVQQIFMKLWQNRDGIVAIDNFAAYINRATRNQSYSVLKVLAAQASREVELTDNDLRDCNNSEHLLLYNESTKILKSGVDSLPPQRKLVYELCHDHGMKYSEVASKLNIAPGTVHTHMKLALKTIRTHFESSELILFLIVLFRLR
jgi:RNA polymerase sigma-70 factor (family 1)